MQSEEQLKLAKQFIDKYGRYKGWEFDYEYPGFLSYYHSKIPFKVYFTPDWSYPNEVDIQINDEAGESVEVASLPFFSKTAEDLFAIVRQWLDFVEWNVNPKEVLEWRPGGPKWTPRK